MADADAALALRVRANLARRGADDPFITYQSLASALGLSQPGAIRKVAVALETSMREDVAAGRPMIAALVISRTSDMPQRGFFDMAVALGRFPAEPYLHRAAWQAECAAVLSHDASRPFP